MFSCTVCAPHNYTQLGRRLVQPKPVLSLSLYCLGRVASLATHFFPILFMGRKFSKAGTSFVLSLK